ncbi:putative coatomer protein complex, gamma sub-unit [Besnoitia besnoiti]|uniref:Putative coatomer protein complex, gamma sub-unit n=1 Tax=Besnoitia besnoiti TaxID=94643 RepID=A0A2A9M186_BESBE|nr:putative coatomer protein complex, gamma sub-unit [Besnoitia besnoiti]PFH31729.1 putative coatomer protein complex, gamma sub-unit [Besnoitia besnoiti]
MLSQFYVLAPRGDCLITKDYRSDAPKGAAEIFYRHVTCAQVPAAVANFSVSGAAGGAKSSACACRSALAGISALMSRGAGATGEAAPLFCVNGVTFAYLRRSGLYFVLTTQQNPSPALLIELLHRLTKIIQDFCGVLNEEAIRKNFVLIYELLDETIDFGYPQLTSTESLKSAVYSETVLVDPPPLKHLGGLSTLTNLAPKTIPSNASHRPVGATAGEGLRGAAFGGRGPRAVGGVTRRSEIFVDVLERLTVVLSANGHVAHASLDGSIQMKSYLDGKFLLKLALNDDIVFNQGLESQLGGFANGAGRGGGGSTVSVDACNFHECVDLAEFDAPQRVLTFVPPDGEFVLMNYRVAHCQAVPFRIFPLVDWRAGQTKGELTVKVKADVPEQTYAASVTVSVPLPKSIIACSTDVFPPLPVQARPFAIFSAEFLPAEKRLVWNIRKFHGGAEMILRARFTSSTPATATASHRKEFGPINMTFEIPMFNVSNLQVRYLRIADKNGAASPFRWVRYVTQSSSYICRV